MRHLLRLATFAFSAILLSFPALCPAQNHIYDQWCFGLEMGLDFRSGSPRLFRPQIRAIEGGASICDANTGALLFYTDGVTVWNRNHQVMSNGTGLMGHLSTTQSSLIVPHPADPDLYYLFTADAGPYGLRLAGIHYSIVDMRGDGGLGTVGQKNIPLLKEATEKLVGIYHCDANSIWVLAHELGSDRFFAWEVTAAGLNTTPVISAIGNIHSSANDLSSTGYLKASPNGHYLASVNTQLNKAEIFQFNSGTGVVTAKLGEVDAYYGASFSPNSKYLYTTLGDSLQSEYKIFQYTMLPGNSKEISETQVVVATVEALPLENVIISGALQIAPDRAIYVTASTGLIGRIVNPDLPGASFERDVIPIPDIFQQRGQYGLPNCIDGLFSITLSNEKLKARIIVDDTAICAGERLGFYDRSTGNPSLYEWEVSGKISLSSSGQHLGEVTFPEPGRYRVSLQVANGCGMDIDSIFITVFPQPVADAGPDRSICLGASVQLSASGEGKYRWRPSRGLSCDTCPNPVASPTTTTTYELVVETEEGCLDRDSITVTVNDVLEVRAESDTGICIGESVTLRGTGANEYEWLTFSGETICTDCAELDVTPERTTSYILYGRNAEDCEGYDTVTVTVHPIPVADAGRDTAFCVGNATTLGGGDPQPGLRYQWIPDKGLDNPNALHPVASPVETTLYELIVTDERSGCFAMDSVTIIIHDVPVADAGRDTTFCIGGTTLLGGTDGEPGLRYQWTPDKGLDDPNAPRPVALVTQTTTYTLLVTDLQTNCTMTDSVRVVIHDAPIADAGRDTAFCIGGEALLGGRSREPGLRYQWTPAPGLSDPEDPRPLVSPMETTTYELLVTDEQTGCFAIDSVTVIIHNLPIADAGKDTAFCFGGTALLGGRDGEPGLRYQWRPDKGLDDPNAPHPIASPSETTTYILQVTDVTTGCEAFDTVTVHTGDKLTLRSRIARDYRALIGEQLEIAVEIDEILPGSGISDIQFELEYDPGVMYLDVNSIERLLEGTLLEGWNVSIETVSPGYLHIILTAPASEELAGDGTLLRFAGALYLGAMSETGLEFRLGTSHGCVDIITEAGHARLDTICGLNFRLIELIAGKYTVPQALPNPSGEHVRIAFSTGLDGPIRLDVFDVRGNRIGVLVDRELEAGNYMVEWNAAPSGSGVYWLRLQSGDLVKTGRVVVE